MLRTQPHEPLERWQQAAVEAFCKGFPCAHHLLVRKNLRERLAFREICALIRTTIGCPRFRDFDGCAPEPGDPDTTH